MTGGAGRAARGSRGSWCRARLLVFSAAALAAAVVSASCGREPARVPSLYDALGSPWAHLYYPLSSARCHTASGASTAAGGVAPAYATTVLTARASSTKLFSWYESSLTEHGWHALGSREPRGAQRVADYFAMGNALFEVAIDDPSRLERAGCHVTPPSRLVYEVSYILVPPDVAGSTTSAEIGRIAPRR